MPKPKPNDFAPYREEITGCWCDLCTATHSAQGAGMASLLLLALREGTHSRMTKDEYAEQARAHRDRRIAEAREQGKSDAYVATLERGYATFSMRDFYASGTGMGMTPHD